MLAEDLGPSEVASWAGQIAGIVLAQSGATAHAAIVARSLGIPLVTGVGATALEIPDGEQIAVDADRGLVLRNFSPATRVRFRGRIERARSEAERALSERHEPAVTRDGRAVRLLANAGTRAEVDAALAAGAEGIGLLRTELAFLDATGWPDEESHRSGARAAARAARAPHRDGANAGFRRRQDAAVPGRAPTPRARSAGAASGSRCRRPTASPRSCERCWRSQAMPSCGS